MTPRPLDWLRAARPLALGNIWPPLLAGWFLALEQGAPGGSAMLWLLLQAGLFHQQAIVFLNDLADRDADSRNNRPTLFSGGSRVLQEGRITPAALRRGSRNCFFCGRQPAGQNTVRLFEIIINAAQERIPAAASPARRGSWRLWRF